MIEMGLLLLGLVLLALPIVSVVLAISARNRIGAVQARVESLGKTVALLSDELNAMRNGLPPASPASAMKEKPQEDTNRAQEEPDAPVLEPVLESTRVTSARASVPITIPRSMPPAGTEKEGEGGQRRDFESRVGGRWTVILGGLATALGAVLLVRATIEAGLLGPAARITLAAIFSMLLFAGGEYLRRRDRNLAVPAFPNADIPAILTGVGAVAAFATVYAAYALYGFIGPATAFLGLTLVGLASLALSAVHGQGLAALGVVGSFGTPLLVTSAAPDPYVLAVHVLVVTASTLGIAALRRWLWLAFAGVAGASAWTVLAVFFPDPGAGLAGLAMLAGAGVLYAAAFGRHAHGMPQAPEDQPADRAAAIAFGALAAVCLAQMAANGDLPQPAAAIVVSLILAFTAALWAPLAPVSVAAAFVVVAGIAMLDLGFAFEPGLSTAEDLTRGLVPPDTAAYVRDAFFTAVPAAIVLVAGAWRAAANAPRMAGWLASAAAAIAFLGLVVSYLRVVPFQTDRLFGWAALVLAFACGAAVEAFTRKRPGDLAAAAPAAFAVASVSALSFALAVTLDTGWMPLAFALASAGIAFVHGARPVGVLPGLAAVAAIIAVLTLGANLPFDASDIRTTPLFNELILLAGLPGLALVGGGEWMRRNGVGIPAALQGALGLALCGLFVALEIRHWLNGGTIGGNGAGLAETATYAIAALGFSLGLQHAATRTGAGLYANATAVAGAISAVLIGGGLLLLRNPLIESPQIGDGLVFNLLLPTYLVPALIACAVAMQARPVRPRWYVLMFAGLAGLLFFMWLTLSIRHFWKGDSMEIWHSASEAEVWSYSVAWLVLGVAVLAIGHLLKSLPIRVAAGILIALTVTKVFVVDLPALTGAMRAFSVIGLGLSLLAIGRFYQRILLTGRNRPMPVATAGKPTE